MYHGLGQVAAGLPCDPNCCFAAPCAAGTHACDAAEYAGCAPAIALPAAAQADPGLNLIPGTSATFGGNMPAAAGALASIPIWAWAIGAIGLYWLLAK